jgi:hypothetical protein
MEPEHSNWNLVGISGTRQDFEQNCKTQTFGPNLCPSQPKPNLS